MTPATIVTGASSGIGAALARAFAPDPGRLVLIARDESALTQVADALAGVARHPPLVLPLDVSRPDAADTIRAALEREGLTPDILINNAGYGLHGPADTLPLEGQLGIVDVNVSALVALTRALLPDLIARGTGGILNVASLAAYVPGPYMAAYYASKAFVLSFSRALSAEVRGTGVTVTALCPGPTATDFGRRAGFRNRRAVDRFGVMSAAEVAADAHAGFRAGRRVVIPGQRNRWAAILGRIMPQRIVLRAVALAQRIDRS